MSFSYFRLGFILAVVSAVPVRAFAAEEGLLNQAWEDNALLRVQDAYDKFSAAQRDKSIDKRQVNYGLAISLLNLQPKTSGNISRAAELLTQIMEANPNDELGIASLYFLARIEQVHRTEPNYPQALDLYEKLIRRHPTHQLAQLAVTKIAILKLYETPENMDRKEALAEVEKLAPLLTDPLARCNFDLIVGTACIHFSLGDEKAMDYLIEADKIGIPVQILSSHALLRIGNLALRLGRKDIATTYFERFVAEFSHDRRAYTVRLKLKELKGAAG